MGNFYVNYTVRGVDQQAVAGALAGRHSAVTPADHGAVIVFDEESDGQDTQTISSLAMRMSEALHCPVLAVLNHDDVILWYQLYLSGRLEDEYDSAPGYFEAGDELPVPSGGNAGKLCAAFGATTVEQVEEILRKSGFEGDSYTFAADRHADLVRALGLNEWAVGTAYASLEEGELPEGLSPDDIVHTA